MQISKLIIEKSLTGLHICNSLHFSKSAKIRLTTNFYMSLVTFKYISYFINSLCCLICIVIIASSSYHLPTATGEGPIFDLCWYVIVDDHGKAILQSRRYKCQWRNEVNTQNSLKTCLMSSSVEASFMTQSHFILLLGFTMHRSTHAI